MPGLQYTVLPVYVLTVVALCALLFFATHSTWSGPDLPTDDVLQLAKHGRVKLSRFEIIAILQTAEIYPVCTALSRNARLALSSKYLYFVEHARHFLGLHAHWSMLKQLHC